MVDYKPKLAIIGSGIAGLSSSWYLRKDYDIHLYEKNSYAGGHTNTISVAEEEGDVPIDTGFMVYNETTYPNLTQLFKELGVDTMDTSMSFGVSNLATGLEYACTDWRTYFAQRRHLANPRHWLMLKEMLRYFRSAEDFLVGEHDASVTIEDFIVRYKLSPRLVNNFLLPMAAAIWSTPADKILEFPALAMISFLWNHRMLGIGIQLQWKTVAGGSKQYRDKILDGLSGRVSLNRQVKEVHRLTNSVLVIDQKGCARKYDAAIIATHANQALKILAAPTSEEQRLLGSFRYNRNPVVLHSDETVMPRNRNAWASWNFRYDPRGERPQSSTHYWMNRLQRVSDSRHYFVNVDYEEAIDDKLTHWSYEYEHPRFEAKAIRAQKDLKNLNENGLIYFCGSYFKNGFHEDALSSALEVVRKLKNERTRYHGIASL